MSEHNPDGIVVVIDSDGKVIDCAKNQENGDLIFNDNNPDEDLQKINVMMKGIINKKQ